MAPLIRREAIMRVLRQSFVWQFAGGFALGAAVLVVVQPPEARHVLVSHFEHAPTR